MDVKDIEDMIDRIEKVEGLVKGMTKDAELISNTLVVIRVYAEVIIENINSSSPTLAKQKAEGIMKLVDGALAGIDKKGER